MLQDSIQLMAASMSEGKFKSTAILGFVSLGTGSPAYNLKSYSTQCVPRLDKHLGCPGSAVFK